MAFGEGLGLSRVADSSELCSLRGDFSSWMTSMAFFAFADVGSSPSSSDEEQPSESGSSSLVTLA